MRYIKNYLHFNFFKDFFGIITISTRNEWVVITKRGKLMRYDYGKIYTSFLIDVPMIVVNGICRIFIIPCSIKILKEREIGNDTKYLIIISGE